MIDIKAVMHSFYHVFIQILEDYEYGLKIYYLYIEMLKSLYFRSSTFIPTQKLVTESWEQFKPKVNMYYLVLNCEAFQ